MQNNGAKDQWLIQIPGMYCAVFFLPLRDSLPLPDRSVYPQYSRLDHARIECLEDYGDDFDVCLELLESPRPQRFMQRSDLLRPDYRDFSDKHWFQSSLLLHQVRTSIFSREGTAAAMSVFDAMMGMDLDLGNLSPISMLSQTELPESPDAEVLTVAEVVVPLFVFDIEMEHIPAPVLIEQDDRPDARIGSLIQVCKRDELVERLSIALNDAISHVQLLQKSIYAASGAATELCTRRQLPDLMPVILRRSIDARDRQHWIPLTVMPHPEYRRTRFMDDLSEAAAESVFITADSFASGGPFTAHMDIRRDADVAHRNGAGRTAAILYGAASESLLDDLLMHLIWEEGVAPEGTQYVWSANSTLVKRVRSEFPGRLGGDWSFARGPIGGWYEQVYKLRSRCVHSGYNPSLAEVGTARDALGTLVSFLSDRLSRGSVFNKYPITAYRLVGVAGLERRGVRRSRVDAALSRRDAPPDEAVFARWKETLGRLRDAENGQPRRVDLANASDLRVIAVWQASGQLSWVLHAWKQHLAAVIEVQPDGRHSRLMANIEASRPDEGRVRPNSRLSILIKPGEEPPYNLLGEWVEEYHLLPLYEVMSDWSDGQVGDRHIDESC